eukprot:GHVU01216227.1.p6 GENE.GHVU01216227.1~~GHVU01216227.1.p6  ORF type:complete len:108 (-),score=5.40 GHVU01216227.1:574-897(-)
MKLEYSGSGTDGDGGTGSSVLEDRYARIHRICGDRVEIDVHTGYDDIAWLPIDTIAPGWPCVMPACHSRWGGLQIYTLCWIKGRRRQEERQHAPKPTDSRCQGSGSR